MHDKEEQREKTSKPPPKQKIHACPNTGKTTTKEMEI